MNSKLILASRSAARRKMLAMAGLRHEAIPANIDEESLLARLEGQGTAPAIIAAGLAQEKALTVSRQAPDALVIGGDQILCCGPRIYSKAANRDEARRNLHSLRGRQHELVSAVCVAQNDRVLWEYTDSALMVMRDFSDSELDDYMDDAGDEALLGTVGAYELEGMGRRLFSHTDGDFFTILGMPLLPLISFLLRR